MGWSIREHTADLLIESIGDDAGACLNEAGLALTSVITGSQEPHNLGSDEEVAFTVEAPDKEALAVAFLSELLWLTESKDLLWTGGGVSVTDAPENMLRAKAKGNTTKFRHDLHGHGVEVKAITYHEIQFEQLKGDWHARVLLDI